MQDSEFSEQHEEISQNKFYTMFKTAADQFPDYALKVSHYFKLKDGEPIARADIALKSAAMEPDQTLCVLV